MESLWYFLLGAGAGAHTYYTKTYSGSLYACLTFVAWTTLFITGILNGGQ